MQSSKIDVSGARPHRAALRRRPLLALRGRLLAGLVFYFFAGAASQKLVPGVDEIFPFFGWSLFSKVPNVDSRYTLLVDEQDGRRLDPPVRLQGAPEELVRGNRYIARKVVQKLGRAVSRGEEQTAADLRRQLEGEYLAGELRYRLVFERYEPMAMWRHGTVIERRELATFDSGSQP